MSLYEGRADLRIQATFLAGKTSLTSLRRDETDSEKDLIQGHFFML